MTIAASGRSPWRSAREPSTLFPSASCENGAMRTAAARGKCRAKRIRDKTANSCLRCFPASVRVADDPLEAWRKHFARYTSS